MLSCGSLSGLVVMNEHLRVCLDSKIILMLNQFPMHLNFSETPFTHGIYARVQRLLLFIQATVTLGINDWVNETFWITIELEITSQAADFIKQVLSFLTYGGSSTVKTLNQTSFYVRWMVRIEVEILFSVGELLVNFGGQCRLIPGHQNIQKGNWTVSLYFHSIKLQQSLCSCL
jgi:hypothetical protein